MNINFSVEYFIGRFPEFIKFLPITLSLALISIVIGLVVGTSIALIRTYEIKILYPLSKIYVSFFRGTPLLVQLFIFYYGLPQIIPSLGGINAYTAAFLTLSINSSAYMSEIIRAAINSVDKGQMEAALSVGMTYFQGMTKIVLPQAARIAIPSLGNTFISLMKETSLAFVLGVSEMLAAAKMGSAASYRFFENYLAVGIIYWIITILFTYIIDRLERNMSKAY
ncbi:amino acid ABC transporter permease [Tepidibacter hydrothermalis]|uniref:Amino acid ABC transporter permease n=1 Tax=Tepidibacter hydrothermalis TaxID=3036126 RepID=A0ABY8E7R3_9FIRM|nr:amino acid ABC transporter permease [Tepidibacter hydrothermalis]WFD08946.1 amino acid ABC transporter permease [Tepidibacter hydrothermalis]